MAFFADREAGPYSVRKYGRKTDLSLQEEIVDRRQKYPSSIGYQQELFRRGRYAVAGKPRMQ